jgi:ribonuclease III
MTPLLDSSVLRNTMAEPPTPDADHLDQSRLAVCQRRIGHQFKNPALLESALIHASGADHRLASNERMEFLGDAILGAIVCEELFHQFPQFLEGDLTKLKSIVVSRQTCAKISQALGLREFLVLGKGMTTHPAVPQSVLSDVLESLIAAIYLDGGPGPAREFVLAYFGPEIESAASGDTGGNYKSLLQQFSQREHGVTPTYHLLDEKGPDHSKCFKITAQIGPQRFPPAWGRSKKESEQRAAHNAICDLRGDPIPYPSDDVSMPASQ